MIEARVAFIDSIVPHFHGYTHAPASAEKIERFRLKNNSIVDKDIKESINGIPEGSSATPITIFRRNRHGLEIWKTNGSSLLKTTESESARTDHSLRDK